MSNQGMKWSFLILITIINLFFFNADILFAANMEQDLSYQQLLSRKNLELSIELEKLKGKSANELIKISEDKEKSLLCRQAAVIILGEVGNLETIPKLESIYKSIIAEPIIFSPYPQGGLLKAIAKSMVQIELGKGLSISEKIPLLLEVIKANYSSEGNVRCLGTSLILEDLVIEERGVILISEGLKDKNSYVRRIIVQILGKKPKKEATEYLIEALKDEDKIVRIPAAWAIGEIGDSRAIPALKDIIDNLSEDEDVRSSAIRALKKIEKQ